MGLLALAAPDKPAVIVPGLGTISYGELEERSLRLAKFLRSRGMGIGDTVAICMENNLEYLEALWAAHRSGLYYTAVSCRLVRPEICYIVNDCGAGAFITSSAMGPLAVEIRDRIPTAHTTLMVGPPATGYESYQQAIERAPEELLDTVEGRHMLYSSGTTGKPKGVRAPLPPPGTPDSAESLARHLWGFDEASVLLSPAPLYHAAPLRFTMAMTRVGGTVVLMQDFDPRAFLELVQEHKVTHALMVPTMFVRLLKLSRSERESFDVSSLRVCVHGAAPCPAPIKEEMINWWGPILHEYYAGTEENGFVACNSQEWLDRRGTVGKPLMSFVHIVGDQGEELPPNQTGTVYFESTTQFEYHNDPEKTRSSYNDRGWSTLGDVGHVDDDGYLYLTDRKTNVIISGGVNIYPREIEDLLITHPQVADVAVLGVPNEEFGEEVKAVVQPAAPQVAGPGLEQDLIAFCKQSLASFKCPRSVDFEAELPRQATGKLMKRLLRDRYWVGHDTRIV